MAARVPSREKRLFGAVLFGAGSVAALHEVGPVYIGGLDILGAAAGLGLLVAGTRVAADGLWYAGSALDWLDARRPRGVKATGGWVRSVKELKGDLIHRGWAPYWGSFKKGRQPIVADVGSNSCILGPCGSGKDVRNVLPNILAIRHSKTVVSFKGDEAVILADALRKRGEEVHILNIGDVFADLLGPSAEYNPLHTLTDNFTRKGGIRDVTDDVSEMGLVLYPEPKDSGGGANDNGYFRNGSRSMIGLATLLMVLTKGYDATLGDVLQLLNDRKEFTRLALLAAGELKDRVTGKVSSLQLADIGWIENQSAADLEAFQKYLRGLASGIADVLLADDTRIADSFLTGAVQALSRFNITTRAHKVTQRSTFRFADQKAKGKTVTVFLVADSSRMEAQRPVLELIQFCMLNEWKRHPNKRKPVYLIGNEAGNFRLYGLASLLTWGRAYSIKLFLYLQSFAAFRITYGEETLNTLLSEREIFQILPGQRDPETLRLISELLGDKPVMVRNSSGGGAGMAGPGGFSLQEDTRPLMTPDEIRRCEHTILLLRKNRPALVHTPSIAAIAPFRSQQGVSPFYGKRYRLPVELRLRRFDWSFTALRARIRQLVKFVRRPT